MIRLILLLIFSFWQGFGCFQLKFKYLSPIEKFKFPLDQQIFNSEPSPNVLFSPKYVYFVKNSQIETKRYFLDGTPDKEFHQKLNQKYSINTSLLNLIDTDFSGNIFIQKFEQIPIFENDSNSDSDSYSKKSGEMDENDKKFEFSEIILLNEDTFLEQPLLESNGISKYKFEYIEEVFPYNNPYTLIFHQENNQMVMSYFLKSKHQFSIGEDAFFSNINNNKFELSLDRMFPSNDGNSIIASISFFDSTEHKFKYKKIFHYLVSKNELKEIKKILDPRISLVAYLKNTNYYLWETVDSKNTVQIQLFNLPGDNLSNFQLYFEPPVYAWKSTKITDNGDILSVKLIDGYWKIFLWK